MKYVSTRGEAPALLFDEALLAGLARDGGLYVPQIWPHFTDDEIASLAGLSYQEQAYRVMLPFLADSPAAEDLPEAIEQAYSGFSHAAMAPLRQITSQQWLLELFHGPTLAFKDFAMQVVAQLMDRALRRQDRRATVVGATSGDTGAAAIEAFRGCEAIDIFILHPHGRVTDIQRRQMTTVTDPNVHNIAIEGTFDDCQAIVKGLFNDLPLRDRLQLTGVNSINWARIVAQIVYYFTSAVALGAPLRAVSYTVPTGNFGDIFAGYAAKRTGLPVQRLVIATNLNDSLPRALARGIYQPKEVVATSSPSMDIQLASNFERLLYDLLDEDAARVKASMQELQNTGTLTLQPKALERFRRDFGAISVDEGEVSRTIAWLDRESGLLVDPHTAVAVAAAMRDGESTSESGWRTPMIVLSTAHAAKFPEAVMRATGRLPEVPERLTKRLGAEERYTVLPANYDAVARYIADRVRAAPARLDV